MPHCMCNYYIQPSFADQTVFPFAGALVFVWDTLAMVTGVTRRELSVRFREIHLHTQPPLFDNRLMNFSVEIQKGNGQFQVYNSVNAYSRANKDPLSICICITHIMRAYSKS